LLSGASSRHCIDPARAQWRTRPADPGSGPAHPVLANRINGSGSSFSANRSIRCFRRSPINHTSSLSLLLPTPASGFAEERAASDPMPCKAPFAPPVLSISSHSLCWARHFPTNVFRPNSAPQGLVSSACAPPHHPLPPALTVASSALPQQCVFAGANMGEKSYTSCRQPPPRRRCPSPNRFEFANLTPQQNPAGRHTVLLPAAGGLLPKQNPLQKADFFPPQKTCDEQ